MLPLARSLLLADVVNHETLAEALFVSATRGVSLVRALLSLGAVDRSRLEQHLERGDVPYMRHVTPVVHLVRRLPRGLCERLLALPVREDARTGTVDVAVLDASDSHATEEIAHWLKAPVRTVRTSLPSLDSALHRTEAASGEGMRSLAPPIWLAPSDRPTTEVAIEWPEGSMDQNIPLMLSRRASRPAAGAPADVTKILDSIHKQDDRDAILELVLAGARTMARRALILAVKRGMLVGWMCSPGLANREALRSIQMAASQTLFAGALAHEGAHRAHLPSDSAHAPLLSILDSRAGTEVVLTAIRVDRKPVAIVIAEGMGQPTLAAQRLEEIAQVASEAMMQALRRRRK
jgi:hypothetical protein